jgi:RHS repeat-associated protein
VHRVDLLFGGTDGSTYSNGTWTFCCAPFTWNQLTAPGPSGRAYAAMAYDGNDQTVVLFGGLNASGEQGDTWVWSGNSSTWTLKQPTGSGPPARHGAMMAYDDSLQKIILYGGVANGTFLQDVWAWDGTSWSRLTSSVSGLGARAWGGLVFDKDLPLSEAPNPSGRLLFFGGKDGSGGYHNDLWTSADGVTWTQLSVTGPSARAAFGMAYDDDAQQAVLFGGLTSAGTYSNETWRFDGTQWTQVGGQTTGVASPEGRELVQLAYSHTSDTETGGVFGGFNGGAGGEWQDHWYFTHKAPTVSNTVTNGSVFSQGQQVAFNVTLTNPSIHPLTVANVVDTLPTGIDTTDATVIDDDAEMVCTAASTPSCTTSGSTVSFGSFEMPGAPTGGSPAARHFTLYVTATGVDGGPTLQNCSVTGASDPAHGSGSYYAGQVLDDAPLAYYRLDDPLNNTDTTAANASSGGTTLNGTYQSTSSTDIASLDGALTAPTETNNGAKSLAGHDNTTTSSSISLPSGYGSIAATGLTIEAWVNPTALSGGNPTSNSRVVELGNYSQMSGPSAEVFLGRGGNNDLLVASVDTAAGTQTVSVPDGMQPGTWQQVAMTITPTGALTVYRNGLAEAQATGATPQTVASRSSNWIGRSGAGNTFGTFYQGGVDEVAIYPSALGADRILAHYQAASSTDFGQATATATTAVGRIYQNQVIASLPNREYRLGDAAGSTSADDDVNNQTASAHGGVVFGQPGAINNDSDTAAGFNGATSYLQPPDGSLPTSGVGSVEAWFKPTAGGSVIIGMTNNGAPPTQFVPVLYLGIDKKLRGEFWWGSGTPLTSPSAVTLGFWHHAVLTSTGPNGNPANKQYLYLDGQLVASATMPPVVLSAVTSDYIGTGYISSGWPSAATGWKYFNGTLDEVAFYPNALSGSEVLGHYQTAGGFPSYGQRGAVGSWTDSDNVQHLTQTICDNRLGLEPWWSYATNDLGSGNTAHINVSNGNLVVTAQDSTSVQAHGKLALVVRRAYNSLDTSTLPYPGQGSFGAGWQLNIAQADDLIGTGTGANALSVPTVTTNLAHPLAVTLIDRDGTHHVFEPAVLTTPKEALNGLASSVLSGLSGKLCIDVTYTAPPGVHLGLWRYVNVPGADSCTSNDINRDGVVAGFAAVRPDRLRMDFYATGELLALTDAAGNQIRYSYDNAIPNLAGLSHLRLVYDKTATCTPSGSGAGQTLPAGCRAYRFAYPSSTETDITDPAGRVTRYLFDTATPKHLISVVNPDASSVTYTYGPNTTTCSSNDGSSANEMCAVTDSRGHISRFTYGDYTNPPVAPIVNDKLISGIIVRRGYNTFLSYPDGSSTDLDASISQGGYTATDSTACPATSTSCERQEYRGIDAAGRVGETDEGTPNSSQTNSWARSTQTTWDTVTATCRQPDSQVDDNLCENKRLTDSSSTDQDTTFTYTAEGQPLRVRKALGTANLDTTYGYHVQYPQTDGTTTACTDWTVNGSGVTTPIASAVTDCVSPAPGAALYAISDRTQQLPPRGNAPGADYSAFLTTYEIDDKTNAVPDTTPSGGPCAHPAAPTSNTGLVCETDTPATAGVQTPPSGVCTPVSPHATPYACTLDTYNVDGTRATMTTPSANASGDSSHYSYTYFQAGQLDASCHTNADGWLQGVTDPANNFVAYSYDAAGDIIKTWDRSATVAGNPSSHPLISYRSQCTTQPYSADNGVGGFTETDYGPYPGTPSGATAASAPWRFLLSTADQLGSRTDYCVDANGNVLLTRPPRGSNRTPMTATDCSNAYQNPAPGFDTITYTPSTGFNPNAANAVSGYDANDNRIYQLRPAEAHRNGAGTDTPTQTTYDAFGNRASITDPTSKVKTFTYDSVNRLVTTSWTRGDYALDKPPSGKSDCFPGTPTSTGNAPIPTGLILCQTTDTYDAADNRRTHTDANGNTTTYLPDAVGRTSITIAPRNDGAIASLVTETVYDEDDNPTLVCVPRDFTEGGLTIPTAANGYTYACGTTTRDWYGTATGYDHADRPSSTTGYRTANGTSDSSNPVTTNATLLLTCRYYDPDGNLAAIQDPNAAQTSCPTNAAAADTTHTTTFSYNLLDRKTAMTVPRRTTPPTTETTHYSVNTPYDGYTPSGDLTVMIDPSGNITDYVYDAAHRHTDTITGADNTDPTQVGHATGGSNTHTRVKYDADGNIIEQFSPRAFRSSTDPDHAFKVATLYDLDDRPTQQDVPRYDTGNGDNDANIGPTTGDSQFSECPTGATLPTGDYDASPPSIGVCTTSVSYDSDGRRIQLTLPTAGGGRSNRYLSFSYTDDGLLYTVSAPDPSQATGSHITTATTYYDGNGQPIETQDANHRSTLTDYTPDELPSTLTPPDGTADGTGGSVTSHASAYQYDAAANQTKLTDAAGHQTKDSYYSDGTHQDHVVGADDTAISDTSHYAYDPNGNATAVFSPNAYSPTTVEPIIAANGTEITPDVRATATLNTFSADNLLLTTSKPVQLAGAVRRTTTYDYYDNGTKKSVATNDGNDGGTQGFTYYPNNRLETQVGRSTSTQGTSATGTIADTYDPDGNLTVTTDGTYPNDSVNSSYYLDDSLRSTTGTNTTAFAYNGSGDILTRELTTSGTSDTTYAYSDAGQTLTASSDQVTGSWTYHYDSLGRQTILDLPNGNHECRYPDNGDNNLLEQALLTSNCQPDRVNNSGYVSDYTYSYDNLNRILTQTAPHLVAAGGGTLQDGTYTYAYNAAGNITGFSDSQSGVTKNLLWDHDSNRLGYGVGADPSTGTCVGDTTTSCDQYNEDDTIARATDSNGQLQQYAYDHTGRLINDNCTTKTYDGFDRLTSTAGTGNAGCPATSVTSSYSYDPLDRQITHAESGGATTTISYDGISQAIARETSGSNSVTYQLDPGGLPTAAEAGSSTTLLSTDGNGNVSTLVGANTPGTPTCTVRFDPFGAPQHPSSGDTTQQTCNTGAAATDVFYDAARKDQTTGTYQFGSRTYDPKTATFYTPDSYRAFPSDADKGIGTDPLTANTYTYVNGDPVNYTDPDGHALCAMIDDGNGNRVCANAAGINVLRTRERAQQVAASRAVSPGLTQVGEDLATLQADLQEAKDKNAAKQIIELIKQLTDFVKAGVETADLTQLEHQVSLQVIVVAQSIRKSAGSISIDTSTLVADTEAVVRNAGLAGTAKALGRVSGLATVLAFTSEAISSGFKKALIDTSVVVGATRLASAAACELLTEGAASPACPYVGFLGGVVGGVVAERLLNSTYDLSASYLQGWDVGQNLNPLHGFWKSVKNAYE